MKGRHDVKKLLRLLGLLTIFSFAVSCCSVKVPNINYATKVPINPESVIFILGTRIQDMTQISGSSMVIESYEEYSWLASAAHVCYPEPWDTYVTGTSNWMMMALDINGVPYEAQVVALDVTTDTCIIKIPVGKLPAAHIADNMPEIGERVYMSGFPLGTYEPGHTPVFEGFYAGVLGGMDSFTIPVAPGSSGGGLVNSKGELVAVVSMALEGFENISLTSNARNVRSLLHIAKENPDKLSIIR